MFKNLFIYHNKARRAEAEAREAERREAEAREAERRAQEEWDSMQAYEDFIRENGLPRGL